MCLADHERRDFRQFELNTNHAAHLPLTRVLAAKGSFAPRWSGKAVARGKARQQGAALVCAQEHQAGTRSARVGGELGGGLDHLVEFAFAS